MADSKVKVQALLPRNKQEILPLEVTLELGVDQSTQDKLSFWDVIFLVSKLHWRVSKHVVPSQSLYKGSGKQCKLACLQCVPKRSKVHKWNRRTLLYLFLHARITQVQSHSHASEGVRSSMDITLRYSSPCMRAKGTNVHEDKQTHIHRNGHAYAHKCEVQTLTSADKAHRHTNVFKQARTSTTHSVFVSVWTCRFTVFGRRPLTILRHWNREIFYQLDTLGRTELFLRWIKYT